jgi:hypothetical protein
VQAMLLPAIIHSRAVIKATPINLFFMSPSSVTLRPFREHDFGPAKIPTT